MASAYRESRKDARILKIGNDERGCCLAYRVPTIGGPGEKAFEWISERRGPGSEKKRGKNGHCAGQLQRDRITESCTGKWSATGVLRTLRNRKTRVTGAFRCVGSNSLLWELFITRLMPRLEPGDLRNVQSRTHLICLETTTILLLEHMFRVE